MQESRRDYRDLTSEPLSHDAQAVINARPQHTPGPWHVDTTGGRFAVRATDEHWIDWYVCEQASDGDVEANARLIAAAPDLLAALSGFMATARDVMDRYDGEDFMGDVADRYAAAEAAIAKARGQ